MAVSTFKLARHSSATTVIDTGLNSLSSTGRAVSAALTNTLQYPEADFELVITYGSAPTANTCILCWILEEIDGTNYEDGTDGSLTPARTPDFWFTLRAVTTAQRQVWKGVPLPAGNFKVLAVADTTGQTAAASGNTLKMRETTGTGNT